MSEKESNIFIGLGTNIGNKEENLKNTIDEIKKVAEVLVCSAIYETEPIGLANQPLFYNQVLEIHTLLNPEALLVALKDIEKRLGRVPTVRNGPRSIDADILYYNNVIMKTESLSIPHLRATERAFVLVPLHDIAAEFIDSVKKKTIHELVEELPEEEKRKVKQIVPTSQYS